MKNTNKIKSSVDPLAEARKNPRFLEYSKEAAGRMRLGAEVYNTRISRGLSQQELAALTGTTQKMISNIENAGVDVRYQTLIARVRLAFLLGEMDPYMNLPSTQSLVSAK